MVFSGRFPNSLFGPVYDVAKYGSRSGNIRDSKFPVWSCLRRCQIWLEIGKHQGFLKIFPKKPPDLGTLFWQGFLKLGVVGSSRSSGIPVWKSGSKSDGCIYIEKTNYLGTLFLTAIPEVGPFSLVVNFRNPCQKKCPQIWWFFSGRFPNSLFGPVYDPLTDHCLDQNHCLDSSNIGFLPVLSRGAEGLNGQ
jgi:hypothetical protein